MQTSNDYPVNAQFVDTFFPCIDGVVNTVHNYASQMNRQAFSCVITPQNKDDDSDIYLPYEVCRLQSVATPFKEYYLSTLGSEFALSKFLSSKQFEIFHAHSPFFVGNLALRYGKELGIPVVATFHSKYYDDVFNVTHSKFIADMVVKRVVRFYQSADSVWAVSESTADTLRSYGYKGEIFTVDNGTDYSYPSNPGELKNAAREKLSLNSDKPILLFVGHQIWHKNIKMMLDCAVLLKNSGQDFVLVVAGNGYNAAEIREYSASVGLDENNVRFVGEISDRELLKGLYLSADLFFFPSVYDNAPLVVREAASMRLPSLLVRGSNAAEKIRDGENGYLCENSPEDACEKIKKILSLPETLLSAGVGASETISVTWEKIIPRVRDKYAEVIENHKNH